MIKNKPEQWNKRASAPGSKAGEIINLCAVKPGAVIADVGSGGGFFTCEFAKIAAKGKVYAIDINSDNLSYVKQRALGLGLNNVETFITLEDHLVLPEIKFDLVFMRNMFHHLPDPGTFFKPVARYLQPDGRVVIIDYKKTSGFSLSFANLHHHYSDPRKILEIMQTAGLSLSQTNDFLPEQSFQVFKINP